MASGILFVDDEILVLAAIRRQLHSYSEVEVARSGEEALQRLATPKYAVIVSDLRMPGVDGIQLLRQARSIAPDVVRIVLTGHFDGRAAVAVVNDTAAFRVLIKPCDTATLVKTLREAVEHHFALVRQREMFDQTQSGTIALLMDLMRLLSPAAQERGERLRAYVRHIVRTLHVDEASVLDSAARLSPIAYVALDRPLQDKVASGAALTVAEQAVVDGSLSVGVRLLAHIPSLAVVSAVIAGQSSVVADRGGRVDDVVTTGTRILRVASAFDMLLATGLATREVIARLQLDPLRYPPQMVAALDAFRLDCKGVEWVVGVREIKAGMIFEEDVQSGDGTLLASRGQEATPPLVTRLQEFATDGRLNRQVRVRVPAEVNQVFNRLHVATT